MVLAKPMNLPQMNSLRETGLEKMMKTVRFSTSLRTRLAATKAATISPKRLIATRPKSLIMRSSWPRLMLASQQARDDHGQGEQDDDAQDAVADGLAEGVDGDRRDALHERTTSMKKLSRSPCGSVARASVTAPCQMTRPPRMMAMRVHSAATSARMCELKSTVVPRSCNR